MKLDADTPKSNENLSQGAEAEHAPAEDPRIKSPDDLIARLSPKKSSVLIELPKNTDSGRVAELLRELADLKNRYETEIVQWRDYERRIQEWRTQVVNIVEGLKREAAGRRSVAHELARCQKALKAREDELQRLRASVRPNLKAAG